MSIRRYAFYFLPILFAAILIGFPTKSQYFKAKNQAVNQQETVLIAGRNVNMVSGTTLPYGDPWLQRQNEPSVAVSTRNPLHLLAGANDYRTVDLPQSEGELPGKAQGAMAGDAWVGIYKSFDGGESWVTNLVPGFPQDKSMEGAASPLKQFSTAADPIVRAGTNGLFYYSGMGFNRSQTKGGGSVFVARYIDNNNIENNIDTGNCIQYIDTKVIDLGTSGQFIDMPRIAVDIPRGTGTVTIAGQSIPRSNIYSVYSVFLGNLDQNIRSKILFRRSTDCGETWGPAIKISDSQHIIQGATIAIAPISGAVYIAYRRFLHPSQTNAIVVCKSTDYGQSFSTPVVVATLPASQDAFDQQLSPTTFRTNSYPTMAVDDLGTVYLAWAQRGVDITSAARIVWATSSDGLAWTLRGPINNPANVASHQFMPSMTYAAGRLTIIWYDQRLDFSSQLYGWPYFISDDSVGYRHTVDVWASQAETKDYPNLAWKSIQTSRYLFNLMLENGKIVTTKDQNGNDIPLLLQMQFNPPNYPLFKGGTHPFFGDYIDITPSPIFVVGSDGKWKFNTEPAISPVFHAVWTDNRDVRPPLNAPYDWTNYVPPTSQQLAEYISPDHPSCIGSSGQRPGMRNQNIYTAQITSGIAVGSPANDKLLNLPVPNAFVLFVKNDTDIIRSFRLTIANQPPGGSASFLQFQLKTILDVTIAPYSIMTRSVFIGSTDPNAMVTINIDEIDQPGGGILTGGLKSSVVINGDNTNPSLSLGEEKHNVKIGNPNIVNWVVNPNIVNPNIVNPNIVNPNIVNPNIVNPNIVNPNIVNPNIVNPNIVNPNIVNPNIVNPNIVNPNIVNPNIVNPNIVNPNIVNANPGDPAAVRVQSMKDYSWTVTNQGNTTTSYTLKTLAKEALPEGYYAQLLVYKEYLLPTVAGAVHPTGMVECELKQEPHQELLLNVTNPNIVNPNIVNGHIENPNIVNAAVENATFSIAPGDTALVTLRIFEIDPSTAAASIRAKIAAQSLTLQDFIDSFGFVVVSQAVNSSDAAQGITTPPLDSTFVVIGTESLPDGVVNSPYTTTTLNAYGGTAPYSWTLNAGELPNGLSLSSTGVISGTPTAAGTSHFMVRVEDSSIPIHKFDTQQYSIYIDSDSNPDPLTITTASLPSGVKGYWYGATLEATGGVWPRTWSLNPGSALPTGLSLDSGGVISGTPTVSGSFSFTVRVTDEINNSATQLFWLTINAQTTTYYTISGTVYDGNANPLSGVVLHGLPNTPITAANGSYQDKVPAGWSGTAVPFKVGFTFTPEKIIYSSIGSHQTLQDYNGLSTSPLVSFVVDAPASATAGVSFSSTVTAKDANGYTTSNFSGPTALSADSGTITPASIPYSEFTAGIWTGNVTLSKDGTRTITASNSGKTGSDTIVINLPQYTLNVTKSGTGTGTVSLTPPGGIYDEGTAVSLFADPSASSTFAGWGGDLGGTTNPTTIAMDANKTVTATFAIKTYTISGTITVGVSGLEGVEMTGLPTNPVTNASGYYSDTVTYGWSGTVKPLLAYYHFTPTEQVYSNVTSNQTTNYVAVKTQYQLNIGKPGTGAGTVTSADGGINCGLTCQLNYDYGTNVVLTATQAGGSIFVGWTGDVPAGSPNPVTITIDGNKWVYATFDPVPPSKIRVETKADGSGTVVPTQNIASGSSITVYSISRDAGDYFIANVAADSWSLVNISGGIVAGDLAPAGDSKSAIFTGHLAGSAQIHAPKSGLSSTDSGVLTVIPLIHTVAGNGTRGYSGDGGAATSAQLNYPADMAFDASGNFYIADRSNHRVRKVNTSGIITTFAGTGTPGYSGDNGPATNAQLNYPTSVVVDPTSANLYITDQGNNRVRRVNLSTGYIYLVAGNGSGAYGGDGGPATSASLNSPQGLALDAAGANLYIADYSNNRIRKVNFGSGYIYTVAGNGIADYTGDGGSATSASLKNPYDVSLDASGNLFIADTFNNRIRKVDTSGTITTVAGNGTGDPYSGDGGPATDAHLNGPAGVVVDATGDNLYITDTSHHRVRKVNLSSGIISRVAGTTSAGYNGDEIAAINAELSTPWSVVFDGSGNLYIADMFNWRIRKVDH